MHDERGTGDETGIRELGPDDWRVWRDIRLASLRADPDAFGSRFADWVDADEARWRKRLADVSLTVLVERGGRPAGVACLTPSAAGPELISLWVAPDARGTGTGDLLVQHVLRRAAELCPGAGVRLAVKTANRPARRLYERHGFEAAGVSPDDETELLMVHVPFG